MDRPLHDEAYLALCKEILSGPRRACASKGTEERWLGEPFILSSHPLVHHGIPVLSIRHIGVVIAAADAAWRASGSEKLDILKTYGNKHWDGYVDKHGHMPDSYGKRLNTLNIDAMLEACGKLQDDPESRQAYMTIWLPQMDQRRVDKGVPCTAAMKLHRARSGHLDLSVVMRSSDVAVGLLYDYTTAGFMLDMLALECGMPPGQVHMVLLDPHIYEPNVKDMQKLVQGSPEYRTTKNPFGPLTPNFKLEYVRDHVDCYMHRVKVVAKDRRQNPIKHRMQAV